MGFYCTIKRVDKIHDLLLAVDLHLEHHRPSVGVVGGQLDALGVDLAEEPLQVRDLAEDRLHLLHLPRVGLQVV